MIMRSIFSLSVLFIISVGVLTVIIFNSDPGTESSVVHFAFFLCIWLVSWSLYSLVNMTILVLTRNSSSSQGIVLRRAFEFATVITGTIIFSSLGVLNTFSFISLILVAALLELFFISRRREITKK